MSVDWQLLHSESGSEPHWVAGGSSSRQCLRKVLFWSQAHCIYETRDRAQSWACTKVLHPIPLKTDDVEGSGGPRGTNSSHTSLSSEDGLDDIL